jgi:phospholipid transport system substrate-binding protein
MTTNTCVKCGTYLENPMPDQPYTKASKDCNRPIPAIQSTGSKATLWKAIAFAGGLVLGLYSDPLHAAPSSSGDTVQGLYDALLSTMKNGRALGQSGSFAQLEPVIRRSFDVPAMARLSVGSSWAGLSEVQRQQMTESFGRYISAVYADRFDSYAGQKLEVTGEQPGPSGVIVKSQIIRANGEAVRVDSMMRRNGEGWLISDIYLDGQLARWRPAAPNSLQY